MSLAREEVLLDNLHRSLESYQRYSTGMLTASAAVLLFAIKLRSGGNERVELLNSDVGVDAAFALGLAAYWVVGWLAVSMVRRARAILSLLEVSTDVGEAILLFPSSATSPDRSGRLFALVVSASCLLAGFLIELLREWVARPPPTERWFYLPLVLLVLVLPAMKVCTDLWSPLQMASKSPAGSQRPS